MSAAVVEPTALEPDLRPLMGVRGLSAGAVVLFHLHPVLFLLLPWADGSFAVLATAMVAVDFFFMLSGFVITAKYVEVLGRPERGRVRQFWVLRFARVWPLHAVMVAAFVAYHLLSTRVLGHGIEADMGGDNLLANLLLVHQFPGTEVVNLPSWSLAPEVAAYLLFPVLALLLVRMRSAVLAFAAAALLLGLGAWLLRGVYQPIEVGEWSYTAAWLRAGVSFPAGCLLAVGWRLLPRGTQGHPGWSAAAVAGLLGSAVVAIGMNLEGEFSEPVATYPLLGLAVVGAAGATGVVGAVLGGRLLHWAGRVSYAVYLTHFLVVIAAYAVLVRGEADGWPWPARGAALLAVLAGIGAVGWLAHVLVEEPARRVIRARWGTSLPSVPEGGNR